MAVDGSVVADGRGRPVTVIASGGFGLGNLETSRGWGEGLRGTRCCFEYTRVEPWLPGPAPRRGADRDADEVLAVAAQVGATQAIGMSRGAVAVLAVLAEHPHPFRRVVLVVPPAGEAVGRYRQLLDGTGAAPADVEILALGMRGDRGHPAAVAQTWAEKLGGSVEILPSARQAPGVLDDMKAACWSFLNR